MPSPASTPTVFGLPSKVKQNRWNYGAAVLGSPGVLAYWPLQESSGTTFADTVTGAYSASSSGTVTAGQTGPCPSLPLSLNLNGGSIATGFVLSSVISATFAFWFKTTSTNNMQLMSGRSGSSLSLTVLMGADGLGGGSAGKIHLLADSNGIANGVFTNSTVHDGNWHHYVGVVNGVSGVATPSGAYHIWIDGALAAVSVSSNGSNYTPPWSSSSYQLGAAPGGGSSFLGNFAGIAIWQRALTPDDISRLYHAAVG